MWDVQRAPLALWWMAPLKVHGCVISTWGWGGFHEGSLLYLFVPGLPH